MERASSGLLLELLPVVATFRQHDGPEITARLTNNGERVVRLVMPGDGSLAGWRTPLIQWTFIPDPALIGLRLRGRIALHVRGITQEDVFTLAPGQSRDLDHWILPRIFPGAPDFAASITYSNDPTVALHGVPSSYDDVAVAMVRESDISVRRDTRSDSSTTIGTCVGRVVRDTSWIGSTPRIELAARRNCVRAAQWAGRCPTSRHALHVHDVRASLGSSAQYNSLALRLVPDEAHGRDAAHPRVRESCWPASPKPRRRQVQDRPTNSHRLPTDALLGMPAAVATKV
jgi:hypothetical protein